MPDAWQLSPYDADWNFGISFLGCSDWRDYKKSMRKRD
jgi:hypothetical protein